MIIAMLLVPMLSLSFAAMGYLYYAERSATLKRSVRPALAPVRRLHGRD